MDFRLSGQTFRCSPVLRLEVATPARAYANQSAPGGTEHVEACDTNASGIKKRLLPDVPDFRLGPTPRYAVLFGFTTATCRCEGKVSRFAGNFSTDR